MDKKTEILADLQRVADLNENGNITRIGYREHGRFEIRTGNLPTWSHPVVSGGKLFIRDQDSIYAYDVRSR